MADRIKYRFTWKRILFLFLVILLIVIARPAGFLIYHYYKDKQVATVSPKGFANDASGLNKTRIEQVIAVDSDPQKSLTQIAELIRKAKDDHKKISIAGARHSMGGHTIYPDGIVLDMGSFKKMKLDTLNNILQVGSGARWSEIIPYLDQYNRSIAVMQSNNTFSVGGSISVNCHGWQPDSEPIASTVLSFSLITASGELVRCSRNQNPELFSLVLGGYGLFGVIMEVELKVVNNKVYRLKQYYISSSEYIRKFDEMVEGNKVGMVYGRINVNPDDFMEEAILSVFTEDKDAGNPGLHAAKFSSLRRTVFRSSANSDYGKNLRWNAEKMAAMLSGHQQFTRNSLLNEGVEIFQNSREGYTDILHEYFLPKDSVQKFIREMKPILQDADIDLLNITVRNVKKDQTSLMPYAREEVFGFVMLFNQHKDSLAEKKMETLTQRLIDLSLSLNGTYYLPYRLHGTREQFYRAYPSATSFFERKTFYDPEGIFSNAFYEKYK